MEATGDQMHHTGGPPLGRVTVLKALVPCEVKMFGEHPLGLVVGKRSKGGVTWIESLEIQRRRDKGLEGVGSLRTAEMMIMRLLSLLLPLRPIVTPWKLTRIKEIWTG